MIKIVIDPGHGGRDSGATGNGLKEKDLCLELSLKLRDKLEKYDCGLKLTREKDEYVSLSDRASLANEINADLFYSVHINGHSNEDAHGYETFIHSSNPSHTRKIAEKIHVPLADYWLKNGSVDRGIKTANFAVLRLTSMPAVLVENGFLTNRKNAELLKDEEFKSGLVKAMEKGVVEAMNLEGKQTEDKTKTKIKGKPQATIKQAQKWARERDAHQRFIDVAPIYWKIGKEIGIRPEVAYAQSAKETAFGRYGGVVSPDFNNWAGIKVREGGGNYDPDAHERFDTNEDGVRAHLNHLAAYTGLEPLKEPHGRYYTVKNLDWAGTIEYVEDLGGRWAPSEEYGKSIVEDYLQSLLDTEVEEEKVEVEIDERIKKAIKYFEKKELINSPNYWYKTVEDNEPIGWLLVLLQNAIEQ